jgi:hypothetical protein
MIRFLLLNLAIPTFNRPQCPLNQQLAARNLTLLVSGRQGVCASVLPMNAACSCEMLTMRSGFK